MLVLSRKRSESIHIGDNIVVTVLKQAEDGDALIVRAYEAAGCATQTVLHLPRWKRDIAAHFTQGEIKTFRVPRDPAAPVVETDLLEA